MNRYLLTFTASALAAALLSAPPVLHAKQSSQESSSSQNDLPSNAGLARGKKLVLKDGSFQLIREYQKKGDRVRFYSVERADWEEIPAAMVDWDATAKAATNDEKQNEEMLATVHHQQEEIRTDMPLDVDASLIIAPGIFLPAGEGMFALDGKLVTPLDQVAADSKTDKKKFLERVLIPVPIVPDRKNIEIPSAHAKVRVSSDHPEFYLREAPPDPDRRSPIHHSSRPGEVGPEVELIRVAVKGNKRLVESIDKLFGDQINETRNTLSMQSWQVTPNVYRYTLSQPLPPGEYVLAEILPDGLNLYVWDFGVDDRAADKSNAH
jgi:hypothetical protein